MTKQDKDIIINEVTRIGDLIADGVISYSKAIDALVEIRNFISSIPTEDYPMPEDTVIFQKGVAEGRRLEREDAKWSEEDEDIRQSIIKDIKWERANTPVTVDKDIRKYDKQINWLKSLRPHWKPSEEQMSALKECGGCKNEIKSLYNELKKLI